jgi:NTE family protein
MAMHAFTLAINQRLAIEIARFEETVDVRVVPPLCPVEVSPIDFSRSAMLIERSHQSTRQWLSRRHRVTGQAGLLEPHRD